MPSAPHRSRASKYDPIYTLKIGEHFDVPMLKADETTPHDEAMRTHLRNTIVPTSYSSLRTVLDRHTRQSGAKFNITPMPAIGVLRVHRMPESWVPKRSPKGEIKETTKRVYEWRAKQAALLLGAWRAYEAHQTGEGQINPDQAQLLTRAKHAIMGAASEAIIALKRGDEFTTIKRTALANIHPDAATAARMVMNAVKRELRDRRLNTTEELVMVGNMAKRCFAIRDLDATERREKLEATQLAALDSSAPAFTDILDGEKPVDRFGKGVPFNYIWWNDFAWVRPELHPLEPGARARVMFVRPTMFAESKPRIEDIERWLAIYHDKWAKACADNAAWAYPHPPEYRICGKFGTVPGGVVLGLERIDRNADGGVAAAYPEWNTDDPFALPVKSGTFALVKCTWVDPFQQDQPSETRDVLDALKVLRNHGVRVTFSDQSKLYGSGVFMIDRAADDVADLNDLRPDNPHKPARLDRPQALPEDNVIPDIFATDFNSADEPQAGAENPQKGPADGGEDGKAGEQGAGAQGYAGYAGSAPLDADGLDFMMD